MAAKVSVYYFYSQADTKLREQLHTHLAVLRKKDIEVFDPYGASEEQRAERLAASRIFLCLLSADFLNEVDEVFSEEGAEPPDTPLAQDLQQAILRHNAGEALLFPIIVRHSEWDNTFFGKLQHLPRSGQAINRAPDPDEAWVEVARGLRDVVSGLPQQLEKQRQRATSKGAVSKAPAQGQPFTGAHALVIGVGKDLPATVRDATAVHALLVDPARAAYPQDQARLLVEQGATRARILEALDQLAQRAGEEDTVLVYYSGHGLYQGPRYFLLPNDYDLSRVDETVIFADLLAQKLRAIRSRKLIVLFDCCHAEGILAQAKSAPPAHVLKELAAGSGRVIVSSSKLNEQSWIRPGAQNSVFTACLLEALAGGSGADGYARVLDVIGYLFHAVPLRARPDPQHPFVNSIQDLSDNFPLCWHGQQPKGLGTIGVPPPSTAQARKSEPAPAAPPDPEQLLDALCRLLPAQFKKIAFVLRVPQAKLAGSSQEEQAMSLIQYLEGQHGEAEAIQKLAAAIRKEAPALLRRG